MKLQHKYIVIVFVSLVLIGITLYFLLKSKSTLGKPCSTNSNCSSDESCINQTCQSSSALQPKIPSPSTTTSPSKIPSPSRTTSPSKIPSPSTIPSPSKIPSPSTIPVNPPTLNCLNTYLTEGSTFRSGDDKVTTWIENNIGPSSFASLDNSDKLCITGPSGNSVCSPQICSYGLAYNSTSGSCEELPAPPNCKISARGICFDNIDIEPWAGMPVNSKQGPLQITVNGVLQSFNVPKLALYHGGLVGTPEGSADCSIYARYLEDVIRFVKYKNIDIVMLVLNHWTNVPDQGKSSFTCYCDPNFVVYSFLNNLPPNVEAGIVPYIRPKDSGWDLDLTLPGGDPNVTCDLISPTVSCPSLLNDDCTPSCSQCPDCDATCLSTYSSDPKCVGICVPSCPPGCPNIASQIMKYIATANNSTERNADAPKFTYLVFDGEDAGSYQSTTGFCQLSTANKNQGAGLEHIGYAKGLDAGIVSPDNDVVFPETYWYTNAEYPCTGNDFQDTNKPDICGSQSAYRYFSTRPNGAKELLYYMENTSACGVDKTKNNLESMRNNIKSNPDAIYPMFTLENLSMVDPAPSCLAYNYFGNPLTSGTLKDNVCGTIDSFSYWDWDKFLEFITLFAHKYNVKQVGIYESQFIPPAWMPGGAFLNDCSPNTGSTTTGDTACSNIPKPAYLSSLKSCPIYTPGPAPAGGPTTAPVDCGTQCPTGQNNGASYCKTWGQQPYVCSGTCANSDNLQYNCIK